MDLALFVQPSLLKASHHSLVQTCFSRHCSQEDRSRYCARKISSSISFQNRTRPPTSKARGALRKSSVAQLEHNPPPPKPISTVESVIRSNETTREIDLPKPGRRLSAAFVILMAVFAATFMPYIYAGIDMKLLSRAPLLQVVFSHAIVLRTAARLVATFVVRVLLWMILFVAGSAITLSSASATSLPMVGNNSAN